MDKGYDVEDTKCSRRVSEFQLPWCRSYSIAYIVFVHNALIDFSFSSSFIKIDSNLRLFRVIIVRSVLVSYTRSAGKKPSCIRRINHPSHRIQQSQHFSNGSTSWLKAQSSIHIPRTKYPFRSHPGTSIGYPSRASTPSPANPASTDPDQRRQIPLLVWCPDMGVVVKAVCYLIDVACCPMQWNSYLLWTASF